MKPKSRFPVYATLLLSAIVLILSAAIVIGTWATVGSLSSALVDLLNTVEKTAMVMGTSLDRVTTRIDQAMTFTQEFQEGALKVSQNVQDQGVILTLFPETKDRQLIASTQSIQETYQGFVDLADSVRGFIQFIDRIPFIQIPGLDSAKIQQVMDKIDEAQALADKVVTSIQEIRTRTAAGMEKVSAAVGEVQAKLTEINANLGEIRGQVQFVQDTAGSLKTILPALLTSLAFSVTLFLAWVIYTQAVMIRRALADLREIKALAGRTVEPGKETTQS